MANWKTNYLQIDGLFDFWLTDWQTDWQTDWLIDWLTD